MNIDEQGISILIGASSTILGAIIGSLIVIVSEVVKYRINLTQRSHAMLVAV